LDTLRLQRRPFAPTLTDLGFNPLSDYEQIAAQEGYYAMFRQRAEENTKVLGRKAASLPRSDPLDPAQLDGLRAALRHARDWDSEVHLVIYPYHAQLLLMFDDLGLWPAFEAFKRRLVEETARLRADGCNVTLWDFSGISDYALQRIPDPKDRPGRSDWYWEAGHFKKELGELLLARVLSGPAAHSGTTFGEVLQATNIDLYLAKQRADVEALRKANSDLTVAVRRLSRASLKHAQP
jgi:hypothetical protein